MYIFFFSSRRRHTRCLSDWSSDVCSSDLKCGHDSPIDGVIEGIIEQSGTPYFCFKDLDENKPAGSIRIRVETIDYFLRRYREQIIQRRKSEKEIEEQLAQYEAQLRQQSREPQQV